MGGHDPLVLMCLPEAIEEFLSCLRARKLSPHTVSGYESDLRIVGEIAAGLAGVAVDGLEVRRLNGRLIRGAFAVFSDPRSAASINRAWSAWNRLLTFCVSEGMLEGNPMAAVPRPKQPAKAPKPLLGDGTASAELLERIAAGARKARDPWVERDLVLLGLALVTGMRSAELLGVTLGSIGGSAGDRRIQVVGKGGKTRSLPIEPPIEFLIERYLDSRLRRFALTALPALPRCSSTLPMSLCSGVVCSIWCASATGMRVFTTACRKAPWCTRCAMSSPPGWPSGGFGARVDGVARALLHRHRAGLCRLDGA